MNNKVLTLNYETFKPGRTVLEEHILFFEQKVINIFTDLNKNENLSPETIRRNIYLKREISRYQFTEFFSTDVNYGIGFYFSVFNHDIQFDFIYSFSKSHSLSLKSTDNDVKLKNIKGMNDIIEKLNLNFTERDLRIEIDTDENYNLKTYYLLYPTRVEHIDFGVLNYYLRYEFNNKHEYQPHKTAEFFRNSFSGNPQLPFYKTLDEESIFIEFIYYIMMYKNDFDKYYFEFSHEKSDIFSLFSKIQNSFEKLMNSEKDKDNVLSYLNILKIKDI